jgi:Leucine-rich repeat (LRR) protein
LPHCRCLDRSSVVICSDVSHVPSGLPTSTILLDLDHNRISLLPNSSFRSTSLRRLEILSVQDNGLLHIESGALATLHELRILRLGRNHLSTLPRDLFAACRRLQVLDVHANYLSVLPDHVVYHLHALQVLNVSFNHLTSARLGPGFRFTTQLSNIDLSGNDFTMVDSDSFDVTQWWDDQIPRHINLSYCDVRRIGPLAFHTIPRLHSLSVEGNLRLPQNDLEVALAGVRLPASLDSVVMSHANVTDVQSIVRQLQSATNLTRLDLSHNRIRSVPKRTFFFLSGLRHLNLAHNEIATIESLAGLSRLEYLGLAFNSLERLDADMFEGLHELRVLDVSHNVIGGNFDAEPFLGLFSLNTIDASCNRIRAFTIDDGLESLETLRAAWNRITDARFVGRLPRLRVVDVAHNSIARLGDELFPLGQQRIELANFSGNTIGQMSPTAFRHASFDVVDLSFNRLTSLFNHGWTNVRVLRVHDNDLVNVSADAFRGLDASLTELHLQRNVLRTLPRTALEPLRDSLRLLDVGSNPIGGFVESADDGLQVHAFRGLRRLETLGLRDVGLTRWPTDAVRGLATLAVLDVAENRLSSLPDDALANLTRLVRLDLSRNRFAQLDPRQLTTTSTGTDHRPAAVDLSDNPFDCTCLLVPLCARLFSSAVQSPLSASTEAAVDDDEPTSRNRTSYRCQTPTEWTGVPLAEFCADSTQQCSLFSGTIVASAVAVVGAVVVLSLTVAVCKRCVQRRRRKSGATGGGGVVVGGKIGGRLHDVAGYQFVDETSLTSSTNSSNTTTSGGSNNNSGGEGQGPCVTALQTNLLLAKQWL